jgi:hypothetical protein
MKGTHEVQKYLSGPVRRDRRGGPTDKKAGRLSAADPDGRAAAVRVSDPRLAGGTITGTAQGDCPPTKEKCAMTIREHEGLILRENPAAKIPWLRVQIGRPRTQSVFMPSGKMLPVTFFELMAWGKDRNDALTMFDRYYPPPKIKHVDTILLAPSDVIPESSLNDDWKVQDFGGYHRKVHGNNA